MGTLELVLGLEGRIRLCYEPQHDLQSLRMSLRTALS
jgi:hypothetical protein